MRFWRGTGALFAESVAAAIGSHLLAHYAVHPRPRALARGGLVDLRRRRLVDHVE
jgi:hypothetical protein